MRGLRLIEAKYPGLLFKGQLGAFVQRTFSMLRDHVKKAVTPMLVRWQFLVCVVYVRHTTVHPPSAHALGSRSTRTITCKGVEGAEVAVCQIGVVHWSHLGMVGRERAAVTDTWAQ